MAYKADLNDEIFFSSGVTDKRIELTSAAVTLELGGAGSFAFSLGPDNVAYGRFHQLIDYVDVYRDGEEEPIFSGRVYSDSGSFEKIQSITCEGLLAVLNDSIFRPTTFNGTLEELVEMLISNHNSQVSEERKITIRNMTVEDEYVYRAYETYETTMSRLSDLVDSYGGYISLQKTSSGLMFDWLSAAEDDNSQNIDFGQNLLDLKTECNADSIISVLIPLGAETEDENGVKSRITIEGVNHGNDYIQSDAAMSEFGRIVGVNIWNDVTTPEALLSKATTLLNQLSQSKTTIKVTAVDLANVDRNIQNFHVTERIKVTSAPHGIDGVWFTVKDLKLNLLNPTQDKLTLGDTVQGYVTKTGNSIKRQNEIIEGISRSAADRQKINSIIVQLQTDIERTSEAITSKASRTELNELNQRMTSAESQIRQTADQVGFYFGQDGKISTMFQFSEDGFLIGKADDVIKSKQTNSSWALVDESNNELLKADVSGVTAETIKVKAQVEWLDGQTVQWAIRKGQYITGKGVNLNILWLGG